VGNQRRLKERICRYLWADGGCQVFHGTGAETYLPDDNQQDKGTDTDQEGAVDITHQEGATSTADTTPPEIGTGRQSYNQLVRFGENTDDYLTGVDEPLRVGDAETGMVFAAYRRVNQQQPEGEDSNPYPRVCPVPAEQVTGHYV